MTGYPEHWIPILGNRIRRVHVKDFRRSVGSIDGFVDLLSGDVDFPAVMSALQAVGYDGWVTAEVFPRQGAAGTDDLASIPGDGCDPWANLMRAKPS